MRCVPLRPVGGEVTGLSLRTVDPKEVAELEELLADRGVLILPGQHLDDAEFVRLLARFGRLTFTPGETAVAGFPDLNVVSNVGRTVAPRSTFHVDTSYVQRPPVYTALNAVTIPSHGGETLFTDQYAAYDTLEPEIRERLDGRTITHVATGVELGPEDESAADHPVFRPHPVSGRTSLTSPRRSDAEPSAAWAQQKPRGWFGVSTITRRERTTSTVISGAPEMWSSGTTGVCCTALTTAMCAGTASCTVAWSPGRASAARPAAAVVPGIKTPQAAAGSQEWRDRH